LTSAVASGLARAGACVAVLARNEEKNGLVLAELRAIGGPAIAIRLDVTSRPALAPAIAGGEQQLGGLDILVNNAGIAALGKACSTKTLPTGTTQLRHT
jgi:NAD(P)-dependent dehydrogenase (short-subunit alcohol dehydrogenase family)